MSTIPETALKWALTKIGCAYSQSKRWNTNPDIFDCSSLIFRAYQAAGYTFKSGSTSNTEVNDLSFDLIWPSGRNVLGQTLTSVATQVSKGYKPQPGDVIYLATTSTTRANKITHVVMVKDAKTIVHARGTAYGVVTTSIDLYGQKVVAITRFKDSATNGTISTETSTKEDNQVYYATCDGNGVNVRKGPNEKTYESLGKLSRNTKMLALPAVNGWCEVAVPLGGKLVTGYMSAQYVKQA